MQRITLLDFDGVLYKHPKAMWYVSKRSSEFVHHKMKLPGKHASPISEEVNRNLYRTFGHTVLGLQRMGYEATIEEYNEFVYDQMPYAAIKPDDPIPQFAEDTYVFSNAPAIYCDRIAGRPLPHISDLFDHSLPLKPNKKVYDDINHKFPEHQIFFFDDCMLNFAYTMHMPNWVNVLHVPGASTKRLSDTIMISDKIKINDII